MLTPGAVDHRESINFKSQLVDFLLGSVQKNQFDANKPTSKIFVILSLYATSNLKIFLPFQVSCMVNLASNFLNAGTGRLVHLGMTRRYVAYLETSNQNISEKIGQNHTIFFFSIKGTGTRN